MAPSSSKNQVHCRLLDPGVIAARSRFSTDAATGPREKWTMSVKCRSKANQFRETRGQIQKKENGRGSKENGGGG